MPKSLDLSTETAVSFASLGAFDTKKKRDELFYENKHKEMLKILPLSQPNVHDPFSPLNQFLLMQHYFKLMQPPFVYPHFLKTFNESQNYFQSRCFLDKNPQLGSPSDSFVDKKSDTFSDDSTSKKHDFLKKSENGCSSKDAIKLECSSSPSFKTTNTSLDWEDSDEVDVVDVDQAEVTICLKTKNPSDNHDCKYNRKRKFVEMSDKDNNESVKKKYKSLFFTEKTISKPKKNSSNPVETTLKHDKTPTKSLLSRQKRAEANARERNRVHTISAAFEALRKAVPSYPGQQQRLSKLAILRIASSYILALVKLSQIDYSFSDCEGDDDVDGKLIRENEEINDSNHADSNGDAEHKAFKKIQKTKENKTFAETYEDTSNNSNGRKNVICKNSNVKRKNKMGIELSEDTIKRKEGFYSNSSTLSLYVDLCTKTIREESKIRKPSKE